MLADFDIGSLHEPLSGKRWDPAEVRRQIAYRMSSYQALGLQAGDRVVIHFGNRLEFFAELLAIWGLGGCAIPIDNRLTSFEVEKLVRAAGARFSVIDGTTPPDSLKDLAGVTVVHTLEHQAEDAESPLPDTQPALDEITLILFTSGSTGAPKGVVHTHRSLRARWESLRDTLGLEAYRRTLCILPTHFGHGLICNCLFPWLAGCDLFIAPPFKPDVVMRLGNLIDEHSISFMSSVPSVWKLALKVAAPPVAKSLQRLHVGSAPLSKELWTEIQNWAGINEVFNAYGITETGSWVAGTTGGEVIPETGLIGKPWGASIKILKLRDINESVHAAAECAPGEAGMIWINTPGLMQGYFQRQDLTDAVVRDGWFMTGDIGAIDERGRLFIRGRERDEINKGGLKIYPADIDAVVEQFSAIADVCTFGFEDDIYGENVAMALVIESPDTSVYQALGEWIGTHLAEHKRPVRWYLLDEIPRTSRGKVNRASVMQTCLSQAPLDLNE